MSNYYESSEFDFLDNFVSHWDEILNEFRAVEDLAEKWPPQVVQGTEHDGTYKQANNNNNGLWSVVPLFFDDSFFNIDSCPITTGLLRSVPGLILSGYSILDPGCEIYPHTGPTAVYRSHLGLVCDGQAWFSVNGEKYFWKEKEWMVFNDIEEHQASNPSENQRVVLIVDFKI